ncbi:FCD domain-containing protein [Amycolatopsis carbonis]|uniref:FCD domain-containing protein n=1 Tax=Amycolatopsis carbonis TaxID=715471 RepID=A0A9Y2IAG1_9PSEU|nr:FCD domain-containing protein [Amycolatopsis sp. 2-15]WIX76304.1 FCD domain-containing protein [Amycolatopsis sp. 2-15]
MNAAGNAVLTWLYDTLRSRQQRVAVRALEVRPERLLIIDAEHRQLVAALDAGDVETALRILNQHLRPVSEVVSPLDRT